ncbi:ergothioneine biosynthesis protein EgtB [Herbaspirillum sp. RTI4]|uniref:ergothioneine biosynthesis protein EgtB n=1 Tax=Herbaspirillum sp. RTI4 TaxID=3048640 RepID=UPI002AB41A82|nr:ergothioneine biosynthesis protein EgtB [Herbaspirillum sp. RTI4]MDY7579632.1 ergothioneine biosynthesis protein EgtB [Herbaspirillum sp. RTI4]MEA9981847.1 ergothioneine biosynthesis protein EgtB [Herbaspirillum sp. RTI4]
MQVHITDLLDCSSLRQRFDAVRADSLKLAAPLSAEDCGAQSMADASPMKWHLAHTTWFFETFILEAHEADFQPFHPAFRMLFNSYYEGVGEQFTRAQRGLLTRPSLGEVLAYRADVDRRIAELIRSQAQAQADVVGPLLELGLHHEQQHQELMLTDIQHLLSINPLKPAYLSSSAPKPLAATVSAAPDWHTFDAGVRTIGHRGTGFCFDNELPAHREFIEAFSLAPRLVSNREYLAFVEEGGYRNVRYWLAEGWDWVGRHQWQHPLYWRESATGWEEFGLHGMQPLEMEQAVRHVSYFEAEAYARWADARLPTEAEWELAAVDSGSDGDFFGTAWQWTSSSYAPYPGYAIPAGAVGEYNGKFMVNQYVLRGSSSATPSGHARHSYRNFFPATVRWQLSGIRLARS